MTRIRGAIGAVAALLVVACGSAPSRADTDSDIVLASAPSLERSGLLDRILPVFTQGTGIHVHVLAEPAGAALAAALHGDVDLVLAHDAEAMADLGGGSERRRVAWNDFVVVGPAADPARLAGWHDAIAAFAKLGRAKASFFACADACGTNELEHRLWRSAGLDPGVRGSSWYRPVAGDPTAVLTAAAAASAYTLVDRATFAAFPDKRDLKVLVEGDPRLIHRFELILPGPRTHPSLKEGSARKLADWFVSSAGQTAIGAFFIDGTQAFHPSTKVPPLLP
ncbi:MAG: substrate-binding domain-containing protein [Alphaproteobacteria bacterium]|nr:substrate-binding domain-containing protein [Alphaproteobacteria bacterium]